MMASREYVREVGGDGCGEFKGRRKRLCVRIHCRTEGNQNNIDEAALAARGQRRRKTKGHALRVALITIRGRMPAEKPEFASGQSA
ncbi:hypothetical protein [Cupriavidus basilensis]|uniref:Uncharacterized protein n=1 Tax=Cupriavidus basilensis TaxID=68895 RepID=A0A643FS64_9BURK|nr:hypothetical protein [Cupriavidus basilensis]QOT76760.1 hypothetical protein F7R26_001230 [Cupriavidus basilensis]